MNPSVSLKVIAVLAVVQGMVGALRALQWFDMGSDLIGQGLILLPVVGLLAFARGVIVALLAAAFLVFALGAFLQRSWTKGLGIVLSVVNLLLVVSLAVQGESLAAAVPWGVIPAVMLIYLLSAGGHTSRMKAMLALAWMLAAPPAFGQVGQDHVKAREQNQAHVKQCTERYGYDPKKASSLGSYELGEGELKWRECIYEGIEKFLIPNTLSPDVYRKAITEDRQMTSNVGSGKMSRAERRARVEKIIGELEAQEKKNQAKIEAQIKAAKGSAKNELERQQELTRSQDIRSLMRSFVH